MKRLLLSIVVLFTAGTMAMYAGVAGDVRKERMELQKMKTKDLNKELSKSIEREYVRLTMAGWRSKGGETALRTALENAWTLEHDYDKELFPRAFTAEGTAMGKDYDLAREKAIAQATSNLADALQKELKLMLEFAEEEKKITPQDSKIVRASIVNAMKTLVQDIKNVDVLMELSGAQGANNEILVRVACSGENLVQNARAAIGADLTEKGEIFLANRMGIVFNWREATKADKVKKK